MEGRGLRQTIKTILPPNIMIWEEIKKMREGLLDDLYRIILIYVKLTLLQFRIFENVNRKFNYE